jgi:hypothetical protein
LLLTPSPISSLPASCSLSHGEAGSGADAEEEVKLGLQETISGVTPSFLAPPSLMPSSISRDAFHHPKHENYTLLKKWRECACQCFGLSSEHAIIDLFASKGKNTQPLFCTASNSAISYDWENFCQHGFLL